MKTANSHQLKLLQTQRDKLEIEIKEFLEVKRQHDKNYEAARNKLNELTAKITALQMNTTEADYYRTRLSQVSGMGEGN